jgi:Tol biopolymer transport system component
LLDTRPTGATVDDQQEATGAFGAAETRTLPIAGRGGVPITGVSAVALNITAISPSANSFITAYPSGTSRPTTSNLNLSAGQTIPNMAIVTLGANGAIDLFNSAGTTQLAVDVMGWFATGGDYTTVAPGRLLDTRPSGSTVDAQQQGGGTLGAGETRLLPIAGRGGVPATGVAAVAVNITAVGPTATSFVTAFPAGTTRPNASNLNLAAGRTLPNMALVPLGANGAIELFNSAGTTHLLVDVVGWFPPDPAPSTTLLSKRVDNVPRVGFFTGLDVARDGGFAAFATGASNLIPGDTNGVSDVFVVDLTTGAIERVSVADNEAQLAAASTVPAISDDGRFVTFLTQAAGAGDTNNVVDVYRRDRQTGTTALVSSLPGGALLEFAATDQDLSGNGDVVAFSASRDDGFGDPLPTTFVSSISTDTTEEAALSFTNFRTGSSSGVSISEDGDKVAFSKILTSNTSVSHVFRYDVSANTITQMTAAGGGQPGGSNPVLSDDGVAVVYGRAFTTAVTLSAGGAEQVIDTNQGTGEYRFAGSSKNVLLASSAALVPGDNNGFFDVYLATTGASPTITLLSVFFKPVGVLPANGSSLLPAMSADQQTLVFATSAQNLSGVVSDPTSLVMQRDEEYTLLTAADTGVTAHGSSTRPVFSTDGRYVVFTSDAEDLTVDEFDQLTDVYRLDRSTGHILEVSVDNAEAPINTHPVREPDVSADGNRIVFLTSADVPAVNLNNASDGKQQVFVRDVNAGTTTAVSHKPGNQPGSGVNTEPAISGNGRFVVFLSSSNDHRGGRHQQLARCVPARPADRRDRTGEPHQRRRPDHRGDERLGDVARRLVRRPLCHLHQHGDERGAGRNHRAGPRLPARPGGGHDGARRGRHRLRAVRRRSLRHLRLLGDRPRGRRHERTVRRVREGHGGRRDHTHQRGDRRRSGHRRRQLAAAAQRQRSVGRVPVHLDQHGGGRHERRLRRVPPRPSARHDGARVSGLRGRRAERRQPGAAIGDRERSFRGLQQHREQPGGGRHQPGR